MCQGTHVCKPTHIRVQTHLKHRTHSSRHEVQMNPGTHVCKDVPSVHPHTCRVCAGTDLCHRTVLHRGSEEPGWHVSSVHTSTDTCRTPTRTHRDEHMSTHMCKFAAHMCKCVCTGGVGQTQATYVPHTNPSPRCHTCAQNADIPSLCPPRSWAAASPQGLWDAPGTTARGRGHQRQGQCRPSPKSCSSTWPRT